MWSLILAAGLLAAPPPAPATPAARAGEATRGNATPPGARPPAPRPPLDPVATVREAEARFRAALDAGEPQERLGALAAEYVDYQDLARRALGRHWGRQPKADRAALTAALRALLEATYLTRLQPGASASAAISVTRRQGSDAELHVVATSGQKQVPLDLRLQRGQDGRWRVYDATVAGLALLEGYQEQFPQLLELGGMRRLLAQLEADRRAQLAPR